MAYESTINTSALLMKSARISVPSSSGGFVPLGACRDIKITENWDPLVVETDNAGMQVIGIRNQTITVEGKMIELNWQKLSRMRGGIDTFSTATFTFDSGGNLTVTPQAVYITSIDALSTNSMVATIYYAYCTQPLEIPFPGDDKTDVAEIPFKLKGMAMSTRAVGYQLYSVVDSRGFYSTGSMTSTAA